LDAAEVLAALYAVADSWPNSAHTRSTIQRGFDAGCANPKSGPARRDSDEFSIYTSENAPGSEPIDASFYAG
jgi:hypothetical protein